MVYRLLVGWVPEVARTHGVPGALYWIQLTSVFAVYYRYFHGHDEPVQLPLLGPDALP
jgi:hypothetical protein